VNVPVAVNCCVVPSATVEVCGLIAIDTSAVGVTVSSVELLTVPEVAVMFAVPIATLCASPPLLIVAVEGVSEDHVAVPVRFCVLLSVNVPVAVNCWLVPFAIDGAAGVTAIETSTAEVTVSVVDPLTEPVVAVIAAVPSPTLLAKPCVGTAFISFPAVEQFVVRETSVTVSSGSEVGSGSAGRSIHLQKRERRSQLSSALGWRGGSKDGGDPARASPA